MIPYRTHSIYIADLTTVTAVILPQLTTAFHQFQPGMQLTEEELEAAYDWIIRRALEDALRERGSSVEVVHLYKHDLYYCLYSIPSIKRLVTNHIHAWLDNQHLTFTPHTRIKVLVTYNELILVRKL
jgi:hypothetical protein